MVFSNKWIIFMGLLCVIPSECIFSRQLKPLPKEACAKLRCQESAPLADRLSKLALLPDFVTQTLLLLDDLMIEMDSELQRSASYLMKNVGPECEATYDILKEVLQKQRMREGRKSSELGFGVEPFKQEPEPTSALLTTERTYRGPTYSQREDDSSFTPIQEKPKTHHQITELQFPQIPQQTDDYNEGEGWDAYGQTNNKYGSIGPKKNNWQESKYYGKDSMESTYTSQTSKQWNRNDYNEQNTDNTRVNKYGRGQVNYGDNFKSKGKQLSDRKHSYGNRGDGISQFNSDSEEQTEKTTVCRGVDKSAPHWVPGLDQWCAQNCAAGYCPKTHCLC